ncbi:cytochrome P450 [Lanmaoa asiatica]|nr:cytochrome P450 [Lanmaoa asiatica]
MVSGPNYARESDGLLNHLATGHYSVSLPSSTPDIMIPVGKLLLAAFASVIILGLWKVFHIVYGTFTSPIRHLPGPKRRSWILGNLREVVGVENIEIHEEWVKQCGNTFAYGGFFGRNRLFTIDTRAINHVLTHSTDYQKHSQARHTLSEIVGSGGLFHYVVFNPAFSPAQIRPLTTIFFAKAIQLRDAWSSEITKDPAGTTIGARLDALAWLNRMTLDVISLAGFNYDLNSLNVNGKPNELYEAFEVRIAADQNQSLVASLLQVGFPFLRHLPSDRTRKIQPAQHTMDRVGKELISNAKAAARASATEKGEVTKDSLHGRDVLSLLVKANMASDVPESQRLSDEEMLARTFPPILGFEYQCNTTATTWALYQLTNAPGIQTKLREELLSVDTETPSMEELVALPYLDGFVRETLRLHSPVPSTLRIATKDDVLPLEKPFTDINGVVHDSVTIRKGEPIFIPILLINRSKELWGPDAHEFKYVAFCRCGTPCSLMCPATNCRPERWQNIPEAVSQIPGVWGNLLSFIGGPRACIGYRFSLVEIKAILFTLVRAFEFKPAVPPNEVIRKSLILSRPALRSDPKSDPQLPLLVTPYKRT